MYGVWCFLKELSPLPSTKLQLTSPDHGCTQVLSIVRVIVDNQFSRRMFNIGPSKVSRDIICRKPVTLPAVKITQNRDEVDKSGMTWSKSRETSPRTGLSREGSPRKKEPGNSSGKSPRSNIKAEETADSATAGSSESLPPTRKAPLLSRTYLPQGTKNHCPLWSYK